MKLSAMVMMMMLAACSGATRSTPATPWRVEVATSGGIAGRGVGTYALDSDGAVTVVSMNGKRCEFRATDEELERVSAILGAAKPDGWQDSYIPAERCCDRIEYTMTLEQRGGARTIRWIDDPLPMPEDLLALTGAMVGGAESLRVRYGGQCR